jgi:hypothetical protein
LVKVDDIGLALKKWGDKKEIPWAQKRGEQLMFAMPYVMRGLTVMGTVAMLAVGGGILAHMVPAAGAALHALEGVSPALGFLGELGITAGIGLAAGAVVEVAAASKPGAWILDKVGDGFSAMAKSLAKLGKSLQSAEPKPSKPSLSAEPALAAAAAIDAPSGKQDSSTVKTISSAEHGQSMPIAPVSMTLANGAQKSGPIPSVEESRVPSGNNSIARNTPAMPAESAPAIDLGKLAKKSSEPMPSSANDAVSPSDVKRRAP